MKICCYKTLWLPGYCLRSGWMQILSFLTEACVILNSKPFCICVVLMQQTSVIIFYIFYYLASFTIVFDIDSCNFLVKFSLNSTTR